MSDSVPPQRWQPSLGFSRQEHWSGLPFPSPMLDSILKSRDITLPTKVHLAKAMVFPVVMLDVRVGLERKLSTEELMLLNCGVGEDS